MRNCSEVSIRIKDEERTFDKKFLCYEEFVMDTDEIPLSNYIAETLQEFHGDKLAAEITVRAKMVV